MNQRLSQLKSAAENVTKNNPENFPQVYGLLIYHDVLSVIDKVKKVPPGEATYSADGVMSWNMAMASVKVNLKDYFGVK